jgi:hypothetical protein
MASIQRDCCGKNTLYIKPSVQLQKPALSGTAVPAVVGPSVPSKCMHVTRLSYVSFYSQMYFLLAAIRILLLCSASRHYERVPTELEIAVATSARDVGTRKTPDPKYHSQRVINPGLKVFRSQFASSTQSPKTTKRGGTHNIDAINPTTRPQTAHQKSTPTST